MGSKSAGIDINSDRFASASNGEIILVEVLLRGGKPFNALNDKASRTEDAIVSKKAADTAALLRARSRLLLGFHALQAEYLESAARVARQIIRQASSLTDAELFHVTFGGDFVLEFGVLKPAVRPLAALVVRVDGVEKVVASMDCRVPKVPFEGRVKTYFQEPSLPVDESARLKSGGWNLWPGPSNTSTSVVLDGLVRAARNRAQRSRRFLEQGF